MDLKNFFDEFGTHDKVIEYFIKNDLIYKDFKCEKSNNQTRLVFKTHWIFICCKSDCRAEKSAFYGTILFNSKIDYSRIMICVYLWINKSPLTKIYIMAGLHHNTGGAFINLFKEIIVASLDPDDTIIGGNGIVVEIDESKISKTKNNVEEHLIFGELKELK